MIYYNMQIKGVKLTTSRKLSEYHARYPTTYSSHQHQLINYMIIVGSMEPKD
jgi:hypothetical protein